MKRTLEPFIETPNLIECALRTIRETYRRYDPGLYLYLKVCEVKDISCRFTDGFIELMYVTLCAWNMNSRAARLADFDVFKDSIRQFQKPFIALSLHRLENISEAELRGMLEEHVQEMFREMVLVQQNKPRLVTYSKAFHFLLPNLFVPIDRKYTLTWFYKQTNFPAANLEKQFTMLSELLCEFRRFASKCPLSPFLDDGWNANVPKVIDNIIIGSQK